MTSDGSGTTGSGSELIESPIHVDELALGLLAVFITFVGVDVLLGIGEPRAAFAFVFFAVVPGTLLLTLLGYGTRAELPWLLYAVGVSLLVIMVVGFLLNLVLPPFGIERPFQELQIGIAHTLLVSGLALAIRRTDPDGRRITVPDNKAREEWLSRWFRPTTQILLLLPLFAILSVTWLNRTGDNRPLLVVLISLALIPIAIAFGLIARRWLGLSVWAVGMSLLFHDTLWKFSNFSGQARIIEVWQVGRWAITDEPAFAATTSLLPNATLSPTFAHLGNMNILTQIEVLNPIIVSLIPVGAYVIFRRVFMPSTAALGALVITFIHPFYFQLPNLGRAAAPVLFLVLATIAITDTDLDAIWRKGLALAFVTALITSHYGGSYFVMLALLIAVLLLIGVRFLDTIVFGTTEPRLIRNGGSSENGGNSERDWTSILSTDSYTVSAAFALFYVVLTFGWYIYTFDGRRAVRFFTRTEIAVVDFFTSPATPRGGSAARLTRDYGTLSIELSRYVYVLLSLMMVIGFLYLFIQRFHGHDWRSHETFDEYFALAGGVLGAFAFTFMFSAIWGGGRPMSIAFSISGVLGAVGVYAVITALWKIYQTITNSDESTTEQINERQMIAHSLFAVLIATLLILNTGVAAAVVLGGSAPSNVPLQEQIVENSEEDLGASSQIHFQRDVATYAWVNNHGDQHYGIFADLITRTSANDWYSPQVKAAEDPDRAVSHDWTNDLFDLPNYEGRSYAILSGHNVALNEGLPREGPRHTGAREGEDLSEVKERLSDEHLVYTTGGSKIYLTDYVESGEGVTTVDDETDVETEAEGSEEEAESEGDEEEAEEVKGEDDEEGNDSGIEIREPIDD